MKRVYSHPRLLIFIVTYNAEKTIQSVLSRIPEKLHKDFDTEILIIDDSSQDETVEKCNSFRKNNSGLFNIHVLVNPLNQGYGGNQKIGFQFAIEEEFDFVALLHGDGQYAPECLPDLIKPLVNNEADAVMGSRMLTKSAAIKGGMPLYKFIGNKILTRLQNLLLQSNLSEFHSGYRAYSVKALKSIPFHLNTNDFHFDSEIIIQLLFSKMRICELPIPTYYGDEICYVNGLKYAWNIVLTTLCAFIQKFGIFYDRKYDCSANDELNTHYVSKISFESTHNLALAMIEPNSKVLDIGCGGGYLAAELKNRNCSVTGIDLYPPEEETGLDSFYQSDLNHGILAVELRDFDYVLILDVLEHLLSPEVFLEKLLNASKFAPDLKFIVSTGNVGFWIIRMMLLFGQFNYGKRGILDITHTRLFTFNSFQRLFKQAGFDILEVKGIPAPFPLALGDSKVSKALLRLNKYLLRINKKLFAYQIFMIVKPRRSLALLLGDAKSEAVQRLRTEY